MSEKTFKCKKCRTRFKTKHGREEVERRISMCERVDCELRGRSMLFVPYSDGKKWEPEETGPSCHLKFQAKEDDQYETPPIGAFINRQQIVRKINAKTK